MAGDELAGVVMVLPRAPFWFLLRRYAPTLGFVAVAALASGAISAALLIFGPARRRLRAVEEAARRLGGGDLAARAPVRGGDEVTAMAATFNAMADDLAARANALAAADRVRRQLLADVSHEPTTPITAMRGYLETLTMPEFALDDETRARYLAIVGDETARLERLIGDLLDLAKLEGGGGAFVVEEVPLAELFARVAARHEREAAGAGLSIVSRIEPGAERVRGDRGRLEQALQNLARTRLVCAAGLVDRAARPPDARRDRHHGDRFRAWYSRGARAARLRSVLQGRRGADADRRERAGPVDRQGDRRAARRNDCRREPAGTDGV
jgi:signal transduction histidine kinase